MQISDWIQIGAILVSLITSGYAIWINVQNNRNQSRPYVMVYVDFIDVVSATKYIVIKNFGHSGAKITKLTFDKNLDSTNERTHLQTLVNGLIAPNQKWMSVVLNSFRENVPCHIEYEDMSGKKYKDSFVLNFGIEYDAHWTKADSNSEEPVDILSDSIKNASHAIVKHL
ncbi:hypothetical protein [Furfurilactobacillus entadae]|uniref:hypothetical protein n=1 Tax=Furfurilactobacillus entadae TaxID=2922307 RepID=UPI0035E51438